MSDRAYRAMMGLSLLIVLYFDLVYVMYGIIGLLFLEGITNLRLPILIGLVRKHAFNQNYVYVDRALVANSTFNLDSERIWRLVVGSFLFIGYVLFDLLWFFPWFMGFTIFGAGLSGVCPMLLVVRWLGFK